MNNNNNNNNNTNTNNNNAKSHKGDTSNNIDHKSGQCIELKATATASKTANAACSVAQNLNRSGGSGDDDDVAVIRHEIDIEGDDDDNANETDSHSSKSNFSNIDVECERDERKPNVKNFSGILQSAVAPDTSNSGWISCSSPVDKSFTNDPATIYTNCGTGDTTITHPANNNNGCNSMAINSFKKEVSRRNILNGL